MLEKEKADVLPRVDKKIAVGGGSHYAKRTHNLLDCGRLVPPKALRLSETTGQILLSVTPSGEP